MIITMAFMTGCGSSDTKDTQTTIGEATENTGNSDHSNTMNEFTDSENENSTDTTAFPDTEETSENTATGSEQNGARQDEENEQLLQSASVDLNGDGISEEILAVQVALSAADPAGGLEGRLKIKSDGPERQITFWRKNDGLTGLLTSMEFQDLDEDGSKDVFIIIPDNGASFSISNYFIYSYKKDISYSFLRDNNLLDFINSFSFRYKEGNQLSIINSTYSFSADLSIEIENDSGSLEEYMQDYERRAWIDPVAVDISESSRLSLKKSSNGTYEIKVPLPVFGLATADMIGEIDLYYKVDESFNPVLQRFEVMDINDGNMRKAGSHIINK